MFNFTTLDMSFRPTIGLPAGKQGEPESTCWIPGLPLGRPG